MERALSSIIRKSPMTKRTSEKEVVVVIVSTHYLSIDSFQLRRMLFLPEDGPMSASSFQFFAISLVQTQRYIYIYIYYCTCIRTKNGTLRYTLGSGDKI